MQPKEKLTDVDVSVHAQRAAGRVNGDNKLHRIFDAPKPTPWQRFFKWENLTVAGREVKGFIISPTIAAILLTAFLGMAGWAYKTSTADQRETLIAITEMKTMLNERTNTFKEQQATMRGELDTERRVAELQREKQRDEIRDMKAVLEQRGIRVQ